MKLSLLPVSYFKSIMSGEVSVGQWARQAAEIGLDAIDLSIIFLKSRDPVYLSELRKEIEDAGMHVAVINTYPDLTHTDIDERRRQLSRLKTDIASAAQLGAEMVRVTAGQAHPGTGRMEGINWAVEGLTYAGETAREHGVRLVYENHSKPGVWEYPDFSHPTDIFLEVCKGIERTEIRILFDTANPLAYGDDPLPVLDKVIDRVSCVHVADIRERGALEPVLAGTGIVPLDTIFTKLKRAGYDGWLSIEEASGLGKNGVVDAVAFVRKAWREAV
jgi:Sugar phosphate isomerases/epimerases